MFLLKRKRIASQGRTWTSNPDLSYPHLSPLRLYHNSNNVHDTLLLISRGSALKRIEAVKENMHLHLTTKFPDAAPLVIWALFADTKENFSLRHRGASGLRKIEDSSWSFLYLIMSQTGIQWSVETNETDGVEQSVLLEI